MYDRRLLSLAFLGVISLVGTACGGGSRAGQTPCDRTSDCGAGSVCTSQGVCSERNSSGGACRTRLDCPDGQSCEGGFCSGGSLSSITCRNQDDCPLGQFCEDGTQRCVECLSNANCPGNDVCLPNGTCGQSGGGGGAAPQACRVDRDCGEKVCVDGFCLPCRRDFDCFEGEVCRSNQCTSRDGGNPVCQGQADCDRFGLICDSSTQRCEACENGGQCGIGRSCVRGVCRNDGSGGGVGSECETRRDCPGNQACWNDRCLPCDDDIMCTDWTDLFTQPKICDVQSGQCLDAECLTAADCAPGQGCWGNGHCGECTANATCRQGEVCNDGVCEAPAPTGCTGNADCANGQVCQGGSCAPCTNASQCGTSGFLCLNGACTPDAGTTPPPGGGGGNTPIGSSCNPSAPSCAEGAFCMTVGGLSQCTRACVGNGKGADDDCPSGMACLDFATGPLDGAKFCVSPEQLPQTTPGAPFTTAPGGACTASSNSCQTSFCQSAGTCARACSANRDCALDEVCFAVLDSNNVSSGYHACVLSDTSTYKAAGEACNANLECDSGVCSGQCSNDGRMCDDSSDCGAGTCQGVCVDHCRGNSDCGANETCLPWATNHDAGSSNDWIAVCRTGTGGASPNGAACSTDGECASWWCVSGICTEPCGSNLDCTGALADRSCGPVTFTGPDGEPLYSMSFCSY